mgnify:CR=1 FL=1
MKNLKTEFATPIIAIGTILPFGEVVQIINSKAGIRILLDYYGKIHPYTTQEIEGMIT